MFIGEAPGADGDRQGKPFVGVSGQLFNKMLASIGLVRENIYITNTILWRLSGNRKPTKEEVAVFLPILHRHVELVAPEMLVCLERVASSALLNCNEKVGDLHDTWRKYTMGYGKIVPVKATPARPLYCPEDRRLMRDDFRLIAKNEQIYSHEIADLC